MIHTPMRSVTSILIRVTIAVRFSTRLIFMIPILIFSFGVIFCFSDRASGLSLQTLPDSADRDRACAAEEEAAVQTSTTPASALLRLLPRLGPDRRRNGACVDENERRGFRFDLQVERREHKSLQAKISGVHSDLARQGLFQPLPGGRRVGRLSKYRLDNLSL